MPPLIQHGAPRRSRPSTTRRCAISSFTCTGFSIRRRPAPAWRADPDICRMLSWRRITKSYRMQRAIGVSAAQYLRLVWQTTKVTIEPPDAVERIVKQVPIIMAMWHGQHFLTPFLRPRDQRAKVLISRHRDGEINAAAVETLGLETIRGSGAHGRDFSDKGGLFAFNAAVRALGEGYSVALTADVPKVSRVAGLGIVKIAQIS